MKWLKRIIVIITMFCIVSCFMPLSAFAVDPEVIDYGALAGTIVYDLYGAANNTSLAFDSIEPGPAITEIITLFQEAQAETSGDPVSMTAIGTALLAAGAIGVVYDASEAVYQLAVTLDYDSFGEFYQDFNRGWDLILSDTAGLIRDSITGLFNWNADQNGNVSPIELISYDALNFGPYQLTDVSGYGNEYNYPYNIVSIDNCYAYTYQSGNSCYYIFIAPWQNTTNLNFWYQANLTGSQIIVTNGNGQGNFWHGRGNFLWYQSSSANWNSSYQYLPEPVFTISPVTLIDTYGANATLESGGIFINPNPLHIGDPLADPLEITIPDPATPMPQNQSIHIGTNIPADPEYLPESIPANPEPGVFYPIPVDDPDILEQFWNDIVTDPDVEIDPDPEFEVDPDPGPGPGSDISEVNLPFLPITLPSFNFNLSSIWHYVRDWVLSIGSWMSLMFQVWSQLPYAIVVPVYATAVIVIVLGLYKRFFM